jgi:arylsulfatase A-like enzyme/Flp pilus assembly protein TadD
VVSRVPASVATLLLAAAFGWSGCDGAPETTPADPTATTPAATSPDTPTAATPDPTNLLLITLDTVRADSLNPYGQKRVTSPAIDRMAREGVLFEQVVSSAPNTLPSHASILTGRFPPSHGVRANAGYALPDENETLAEVLKASGYRTAAEIAAPVLDAVTALDQGFDRYRDLASPGIETIRAEAQDAGGESFAVELTERSAQDVARQGIRFLDAHRTGPFFLWLHFFDAHHPYLPHPELGPQLADDPYLGEILFIDRQIEAVLKHLEDLGLRSRTLVVLVADHGEGRGDHGEKSHAFLVYDSTVRVPLIFWGPEDLPRGLRIPTPVRTVDIAPTILDWIGAPVPSGIQGQSLAPLIRGELDDLALPAYGESLEIATTFGGAPLRFLRLGPWKYIHQPEPALYDLSKDPGEQKDLAKSHPERVVALREEMARLLADMPGPRDAAVGVTPERAAELEALGYVAAAAVPDADLDSLALDGPPVRSLMQDLEALGEASSFTKLGLHERALEVLEPLVARYPESPVILEAWALNLHAAGRRPEARAAFERVLVRSPCAIRARHQLSVLLGEERAWSAQLDVLRAGIGACAESFELLNEYAYALATNSRGELRDGAEAVRAAERAAALAPSERAEILDTLAAAYAEAGDFRRARRTAERAVALARRQKDSPALVELLEESLERYRKGVPTRRS